MHDSYSRTYRERYALFALEGAELSNLTVSEGSERSDPLMSEQSKTPCFAKIELRLGLNPLSSDWKFEAVVETCSGTHPFSSEPQDLRLTRGEVSAVFFAHGPYSKTARNVVHVRDIIFPTPLEGLGICSWVVDRFRDLCAELTGPDPWLHGELTNVDQHNPRRNLFWARHVDQEIVTDVDGNGCFCAPWIRGFNPWRSQFHAVRLSTTGDRPTRKKNTGRLYELNGRLAFKFTDE